MEAAVVEAPRAGADFSSRAQRLLARYREVRDFSKLLTHDLEPEDCVVQSIPDVSPTKWHLAHTTWFFETFVLKKFLSGYVPEIPEYAFLFNSYYNAAGSMHRRDLRGLISRPTVAESFRYREGIDRHVLDLVSSASEDLLNEIEPLVILGLHHEQQHQELLVTDIKHVLAQNPLHPVFRKRLAGKAETPGPISFINFEETIASIGYPRLSSRTERSGVEGSRGETLKVARRDPSTSLGMTDDFSYDNEGPQHRALVPAFALASRLTTCGEYLDFIEDNGYRRPEFWLSLGWMTVNEQRWEAPLYWEKRDGEWWHFTLSGFRRVDRNEPVTHVSYFEADAFANWSGARLPTEFEWERVAQSEPIEGNFVESERFHPAPANAVILRREDDEGSHGDLRASNERSLAFARDDRQHLSQLFGDVWEWTRSSYSPYPGYRAAPGALGEYNGKFMCNQYVLRGGSCATSRSHIRATYRNFFQPEKRWQFTGIRLARDAA